MLNQPEYIYLHGFASSPQGTKAQYFRNCFEKLQIPLITPDLNQGDFTHLTLTRQLEFIETEYLHKSFESPMQKVNLIGSSFGGLTAAILAQRHLQVNRLVLLAPAFNFHVHLSQLLGEAKMQQWQTDRSLLFPHYGFNRDLPLNYNFWPDVLQYQDEPFSRAIPTLILHGIHDDVIPIQSSREFADQRPWVELRELESDHSLGNVVAEIWQAIQGFCQL
jgi:pimeloyl-ACP methyl ester carboxylesterase